jgi:hypothetical protein
VKFKIRTALIGAVIYLYLLGVLVAVSPVLLLVFLVWAGACMAGAWAMIAGAKARKTHHVVEFSQSGAANSIGSEFGSFHHVFYSRDPALESYRQALGDALKSKLGATEIQEVAFKDVDHGLPAPETRAFLLASAGETARRSGFFLMCHFTRTANIQGVRWWVLVSGLRDPNKVFWRYAFAPFSVPFTFVPYLRRDFDPLHGLTRIYPGFFNGVDILNRTREMQFVAFETLIEVLDSFGIDTADLRQQKGNILNINVSGGQTSFGSVVQGAMNKVVGAAGASGGGSVGGAAA